MLNSGLGLWIQNVADYMLVGCEEPELGSIRSRHQAYTGSARHVGR